MARANCTIETVTPPAGFALKQPVRIRSDLRGHNGKRRPDADMDGSYRHADGEVSADEEHLQVKFVQPYGRAATAVVRLSGPVSLAQQFVRGAAGAGRDSRRPDGSGPRLIRTAPRLPSKKLPAGGRKHALTWTAQLLHAAPAHPPTRFRQRSQPVSYVRQVQ